MLKAFGAFILRHHLFHRKRSPFPKGEGRGAPAPVPIKKGTGFGALCDYFVIFSCLTLWSMMWREASSLWTSSTVMPIWTIRTMAW